MLWIIATAFALALIASIAMWIRTNGHVAWRIGSGIGAFGLATASALTLAGNADAAPPADLSVSNDAVIPAAAKCTTTTFNPGSMQYSKHKWSDSLSTPFVARTPEGIWTEFKEELCTNPSLGDAWEQAMQHVNVTIGDKTWNVGSLNPWLKSATDKGANLRKSWLVVSKDGKTITVTKSYRLNVEKVLTLLLPFKQQGLNSQRSMFNWPANNLVAGELPHAVEASKSANQESYKALVLSYTHKSGQCDASVGINTGDKRPEIFSCAKQSPAPAPAKTTKATTSSKSQPKPSKPKPSVKKTRSATPTPTTSTTTPPPSTSTTTTTVPPSTSTTTSTTTPPPSTSTTTTTQCPPDEHWNGKHCSKAGPSGSASPTGAQSGTTSGSASATPVRPTGTSSAPIGSPTASGTAPGATTTSGPPRSSTATDTLTGAPSSSNAPTSTTIANPDQASVAPSDSSWKGQLVGGSLLGTGFLFGGYRRLRKSSGGKYGRK